MLKVNENSMELTKGEMTASYNKILNEFKITDTFIEVSEQQNNVSLVIILERRQSSYWISIYIPTICLVLAAEITLFIDDMHFQATIMVALTSNLVMYTLYSGIRNELPADSTLKLIDAWLLHGLLMPMVVFIILVVNELINPKVEENISKQNRPSSKKVISASQKGLRPMSGIWTNDISSEKSDQSHGGKFIRIARLVIPSTSILFTFTFFAIGITESVDSNGITRH